MKMWERAVQHMLLTPERRAWTLEELREAVGVSLRARYRLANELRYDPRVDHLGGNRFCLSQPDHDHFMAKVRT